MKSNDNKKKRRRKKTVQVLDKVFPMGQGRSCILYFRLSPKFLSIKKNKIVLKVCIACFRVPLLKYCACMETDEDNLMRLLLICRVEGSKGGKTSHGNVTILSNDQNIVSLSNNHNVDIQESAEADEIDPSILPCDTLAALWLLRREFPRNCCRR